MGGGEGERLREKGTTTNNSACFTLHFQNYQCRLNYFDIFINQHLVYLKRNLTRNCLINFELCL